MNSSTERQNNDLESVLLFQFIALIINIAFFFILIISFSGDEKYDKCSLNDTNLPTE